MVKPKEKTSVVSARWLHSTISGSLFFITCATCLCVSLLTHNEKLARWIAAWDREHCKETNRAYYYRLYFKGFDYRLLLDELPKADHSRGGVYFFGASVLKTSIKTWELPSEQRQLIHNYGIGGSNHTYRFQFLRYLVDYEGILQAGGEKTHFVMGAVFSSARDFVRDFGDGVYFPRLFRMYGLYTYSPEDGIHPVAMSRLEKFLRIEKIRCNQFLSSSLKKLLQIFGKEKIYKKDPKYEAEFWKIRMGSNWQEEMAVEIAAFSRQIDFLLERKVGVTVVCMPVPSILRESPYHIRYYKYVTDICKARSVRLVDLADLLTDDEFSDALHPNFFGLEKIHPILVNIAIDRLHQMGILPSVHSDTQ